MHDFEDLQIDSYRCGSYFLSEWNVPDSSLDSSFVECCVLQDTKICLILSIILSSIIQGKLNKLELCSQICQGAS